ncbi:MAG TPA: hypothetical protein VF892_04195 [Pseudonocardiaceae bacterium]
MRSDRLFDTGELIVHEATPEQRRRAVLAVAGSARDAADLAELLALLGLDPAECRPPRARPTEPTCPAQALPPKLMAELAALAARSHARTERAYPGGADVRWTKEAS